MSTPAPEPTKSAPTSLADLVVVVDDLAVASPGCDAVSLWRLDDGHVAYRGPTRSSPGRLAARRDLTYIVAAPSQTWGPVGFLYGLRRGESWSEWQPHVRIRLSRLAPLGGIAFLPDGDLFLVATVGAVSQSHIQLPAPPPYRVEKYALSEVRPEGMEWKAGRSKGRAVVPGIAAEILPTRDGSLVHVVTEDGWVVSLDANTMREPLPRVQIRPVVASGPYRAGLRMGLIHAALSPDERFLVVNRAFAPELNIVDLELRTARTVRLEDDITYTGGVAFNAGWRNAGLLAVNARDRVVTYAFDAPDAFRRLGSIGIAPVTPSGLDGAGAAIAWSASGEEIVAAAEERAGLESTSDFVVLEVLDRGRSLARSHAILACDPEGPMQLLPSDILTANGLVTPPVSTPVTPSPTLRADTATPAPTASATATASSTPTPRPAARYLPAVLNERCVPGSRTVEVALVMDASTSMLEESSGGRTKMAAAVEAATAFVDLLHLPDDRAAVISFNDGAALEQSLTGDREAIVRALSRIDNETDTRLDLGVRVAQAELAGPGHIPGRRQAMIVLTDGIANPVPVEVAIAEATSAKEAGTTVFTIGLGANLDMDALRQMASRPEYFLRAPDAEDLADVYRWIAGVIPCPPEGFWGRR